MNKNKKIFVGIEEVSGYANSITSGLRTLGHDATFISYYKHVYGYPYDKYMSIKSYCKALPPIYWPIYWLRFFINFMFVFWKYDYYVFLFGKTLLPKNLDLPILKLLRKKTIMVFLGCDIRARALKIKQDPDNVLCLNCTDVCDEVAKKKKVRFIEKWIDVILAQQEYASILEKEFKHLYFPIDTEEWSPQTDQYVIPDKPLIVHIPSNEEIKGTKYILETIGRLQSEGFNFDFNLIKDVSNKEAKEILSKSDILIDQLLVGWHGRLAVEAMSSGKVVLCYLKDEYITKIPEIPIVNTSKDNIYDNLKDLLLNKDKIPEIGKMGRDFALKYHCKNNIASTIEEIFGLSRGKE